MKYLVPIFGLVGLALLIMLARSLANTDLVSTESFRLLFIFNVLFIASLFFLIAHQIFRLLKNIKKEIIGSKLTLRLVISFALMIIVPVSIVYLVSVSFLTKSINSWFDVKVESALEGGLSLGQKTLNILMRDIELKGRSMAYSIGNAEEGERDSMLRDMREKFIIDEVILYDQKINILALSSANKSSVPTIANYEHIERAGRGFYGVIEEFDDTIILRAYIPVNFKNKIAERGYLEVRQPIPTEISSLAISVESVYEDYQRLSYSRKSLNIVYTLTLTIVLLLAILSAVAISFVISRKFSEPLAQLADATKQVAKGNFNKIIPEYGKKDEIGTLVKSFNSMTRQLDIATQNDRKNQHRVELARLFLDTILTNLSSGVIVVDSDQKIRLYNLAALTLLQINKKTIKNRVLDKVAVNNKELSPVLEFISSYVLAEGKSKDKNREYKINTNKNERVIRIQINSIRDDRKNNYIVLIDDITDVTEGQRHQAWSEVARRLAHEIKNPLTPIQLSAERIEHKLKTKLNDEDQTILSKATNTIVGQVNALKTMVNEFSDYARPPKIEKNNINVNMLIQSVVDLYEPVGINISIKQPNQVLMVMGDENKLRQVFVNLLENAKDALVDERKPQITIQTKVIKGTIVIVFEDNGSGVPENILGKIFEPYVTSKSHGTGLGLAIVLKIIEEHKGSIEIKNKRLGGSKAIIILPMSM